MALHEKIDWVNPTLKQLRQIKYNEYTAINRFCQLWADQRSQDLTSLLLERRWVASGGPPFLKVLTALKTNQPEQLGRLGRGTLQALVRATADPDPEIAGRADQYLDRLPPTGYGVLVKLWQEKRLPRLAEFFQKRGYIPAGPPSARVLLTLQQNRLELLVGLKTPAIIQVLTEAAQDNDPLIAERAVTVLRGLRQPAARRQMARLVCEQDLPAAQAIVAEQGYHRHNDSAEALFYFMTEQWTAYEGLDFDYRRLRAFYQAASPTLRRRVAGKVRAAGRPDFLAILTPPGGATESPGILPTDETGREVLVNLLLENQSWERLWPLVFELPATESLALLRQLIKANWQPAPPDEQTLFASLGELVASGIADPTEADTLLPLMHPVAQIQVEAEPYKMVFSTTEPLLAILSSQGTNPTRFWNYRDNSEETWPGLSYNTLGDLVFMPNGQPVWFGWPESHSAYPQQIYIRQAQKVSRIGESGARLMGLGAIGETQLVSVDYNGLVVLWDLISCQKLAQVRLVHTPRKLVIYHNQVLQQVIIGDGQNSWAYFEVFGLPDLAFVSDMRIRDLSAQSYNNRGCTTAILSDRGRYSLVIGQTENLTLKCFTEKRGYWQEIRNFEQRGVQGIVYLEKAGRLVWINEQENLVVSRLKTTEPQSWEDFKILGVQEYPLPLSRTLTVSPDNTLLVTSSATRHSYSYSSVTPTIQVTLWDIRPQLLSPLFEQPLGQIDLTLFDYLIDLLKQYSYPRKQRKRKRRQALAPFLREKIEIDPGLLNLLRYIYLVLSRRFRHHIELEDSFGLIESDEFDIELDEV